MQNTKKQKTQDQMLRQDKQRLAILEKLAEMEAVRSQIQTAKVEPKNPHVFENVIKQQRIKNLSDRLLFLLSSQYYLPNYLFSEEALSELVLDRGDELAKESMVKKTLKDAEKDLAEDTKTLRREI